MQEVANIDEQQPIISDKKAIEAFLNKNPEVVKYCTENNYTVTGVSADGMDFTVKTLEKAFSDVLMNM